MAITVKNITKQFGNFMAVDNVSFEIEHGQLVALLGPSGSGKSTILRLIAGLETPDSGEIFLTGYQQSNLRATVLETNTALTHRLLRSPSPH